MKKLFCLVTVILVLGFLFAGCSSSSGKVDELSAQKEAEKEITEENYKEIAKKLLDELQSEE